MRRRTVFLATCGLPFVAGCAQTVVATAGDATPDAARDASIVTPDAATRCPAACVCDPLQVCVDGVCRRAAPALQRARTWHADVGAVLDVAVDGDGSVAVGGYVMGRYDILGVGTAGRSGDGVLTRYTADGAARELHVFPGDAAQVRSVALDARGLWGGGEFGASVNVFGRTLRASAVPDGYVVRVDRTNTSTSSWQLSGTGDEQVATVALFANGDALVTGYYSGSGRLGDAALTPDGHPAGFAARVTASGRVAWTTTLGATNTTLRGGVVRADGSVAVVGLFSGTQRVGATTLRATGGFDVFVAALDGDGSVSWTTSYGGARDDLPDAIASDARGALYVASSHDGNLTVGGVAREAAAGLLVALDARGGVRWSMGLGANGRGRPRSLAVDAAGNAVVAGNFGEVDVLEGFDAFYGRGVDMYWAVYDSTGRAVAARTFGGPGDDTLTAVAALPCGGFVVGGSFQQTADLGGMVVTAARSDGFVAWWAE